MHTSIVVEKINKIGFSNIEYNVFVNITPTDRKYMPIKFLISTTDNIKNAFLAAEMFKKCISNTEITIR